jgi:hypothetical protein
LKAKDAPIMKIHAMAYVDESGKKKSCIKTTTGKEKSKCSYSF